MPENNAIFGLLKMTKSGIARRTILKGGVVSELPRLYLITASAAFRSFNKPALGYAFAIMLSGAAGVVRSQR